MIYSKIVYFYAIVLVVAVLLYLTVHAHAQWFLPGSGGWMVPAGPGTSSPPPPSCTNSLVLSTTCNSQYLGIGMMF